MLGQRQVQPGGVRNTDVVVVAVENDVGVNGEAVPCQLPSG